jgi:hypothetical protein
MLSCTEQGLWPDNLSDVLSGLELDALIEHAEACPYHQHLLDEDEEVFLAELRQTASVLCFDPFAPLKAGKVKESRSYDLQSLPVKVGITPHQQISARSGGDPLYEQYRHWSDAGCPLEIIQVRCDGRNLCTFDLPRDGGSWRLSVKAGYAPLQFWTLCRRHQDKVLLAVYPIPRRDSARTEASTLSFANGQSLSVLAAKDGNDFDVWVHCTAPRPTGARYVVCNFDSLTDQCSLEAAGIKYYKTSQLLEDVVKLAELRFPVPDIEAARLFDDLPREKYIAEWIGAYPAEECQESEPLRFSCLPPDQTPLEAQEGAPNHQEPILELVKKWADSYDTGYVYGSLKRVTIIKRRIFQFDVARSTTCRGGVDYLARSSPYSALNGLTLFVGAGTDSVVERQPNFISLTSCIDYELDVMSFTRRVKTTSLSEACRRIKAYHSLCNQSESRHRPFMPVCTAPYEQILPEYAWPTPLRDTVSADRLAFFEADIQALFEKFFARYLGLETAQDNLVCSWGETTQAFRERIFAAVGLDRICGSCVRQDLGSTWAVNQPEVASGLNGDHKAKGWSILSSSNRPSGIPLTESLLAPDDCSQEIYGEVT